MNRAFSFLTAAALMTSVHVTLAADDKSAGGACIDEKAKQALVACSNNGPTNFDVTKHGKAPQVNFHSAPPPADLKKRDQQTKPTQPDLEMGAGQRDQRANRLKARQKALLVTEISGLENLFQGTPKNASDRPTLARRLAEDYVELESAAFREKTNAEIERDNLKKTNPGGAGQKQTEANAANGVMLKARSNAVRYYTLVKSEYPNYPQLDEVLYYLAYEYEQAQDYPNARKVYYELIQKRQDSKYIPNAYLAFGELFFNEAQGDPSKWDLSRDAYVEVIKYPAPNNKVYGYAWYKLAYVFWNKGEFDKALNAFKKTIDYGRDFSQLPNASKLADSARRDIIPVYALKGDPGAAYNFFKGISKGGTNEETYKMMDDLGQNYLDTGHYPEAIALYKDLIMRDKGGEKFCLYQTHISEAILAMKSGNKDAIKNELDSQVKVYEAFKASNKSAEAKAECANKTASLVTETGMAWHLEAVGSQGQRGTGDQKTMTLAAYLYKRVVDTWSAQEFATFQFPRIVKEDWPNIYKIKYAMADLLYFQEKWGECGPAFDSVVAENPTAAEAPEAAYASVLCYQKIYEAMHSKGEDKKGAGNLPGQGKTKDQQKAEDTAKLKPKDFSDNQKGMVQAFNRYICYIKPAANDTQGQEQALEVRYARARTYFEAQHWEEAAVAFRDIAMNHADRDVGIYAAQLYLESVNVIGSNYQPPRPSCFDDMAQDVPKFIELYCTADKLQKNQEQCTLLNKIQVDILRLKAQKTIELADKGGANSLALYEQGGNAYFEMFRKYCEQPIASGQPPQAERCDEIVYNSARAFQAARLVAKAIRARMTLLNPQYQMDKSPLAKKAMYEIGGNYQAIAVYDQAAEWYEKYAKADKNAEKADAALSDAVLLRLGLGQEAEAIADAQVFTRNYGGAKPAQTAQIAFAVGAHYAEKEEWDKAKGALSGYMAVIDKAAPDVQVQAHATLARVYTHLKNGEGNAKTEYTKVRGIWQNPDDAMGRIKAAYPGEDENAFFKRVAKALNAVGEAYFYAAEEHRKAKVDALKFPEYKGTGDKETVLKHVKTKVTEWYKKKSEAIRSVEPDYVKILELKPEPPPKWVIAAGSRSGLMWGEFVDDFRRAPYPKDWDKKGFVPGTNDSLSWSDVKQNYWDALDSASQPFKDNNAKPALKKCLDLSVKYQYFDEFSRSCEVWLAKNYKAEYHVVDEIRGAPTLSNSGLDDKPPPLVVGGQLWHAQQTGPAEKPSAPAAGEDAKKEEAPAKPKPAAKPKPGKKK